MADKKWHKKYIKLDYSRDRCVSGHYIWIFVCWVWIWG